MASGSQASLCEQLPPQKAHWYVCDSESQSEQSDLPLYAPSNSHLYRVTAMDRNKRSLVSSTRPFDLETSAYCWSVR
jgi:hypothetical protein